MSVAVYQFWNPTCGPFKTMKPVFKDLQEEFEVNNWVSVNTHDDAEGYTQKFGVTMVPTLAVVSKDKEGKLLKVEKQSGTNVANYYKIISNAMKSIQ